MHGDVIKEFLVGLGFKVDESSLKGFMGGISSATLRVTAFGAAITAAAGVIVHAIDEVAKDGEKLDLMAQKFHTTAAAMDDWGDTAEIMGIGADKAFESLDALSKVVTEASLGIGRGKIVLEKLGIKAKDASGHIRATTDVMEDLRVKLQGMDRGSAINILDRLGLDPELLRMFNGELGNTTDIGKELSDIDKSVGFDFDKNIAESKEYMNQQRAMMVQVRLLKQWFDKFWAKLATDMMPKVREGIKKVADTFEGFRKTLQLNGAKIVETIKPILDGILRLSAGFIQLAGRLASVVFTVLGRIIDVLDNINKATGGWAGYLAAALVAWKVFNLGFLATPLGAILGLSVAILALYDDFMTWKEGGESLIDWNKWKPQIDMALKAFDMIKNAIVGLIDVVDRLFGAFSKLFSGDFASGFKDLAGMASQAWDAVSGIFGSETPKATPSPATQTSLMQSGANVAQQTTINVNGSSNPHATAQAVAGQQGQVNANMARNMRAGAR